MSNYFPFGFVYPTGQNMIYSDANPDPAIVTLKARIDFLNACHDCSSLPGHVFAAAIKLLQERSAKEVEQFWDIMQKHFSHAEVSEIADALAPMVADEPPRLDFPNAIALVDCRFVSTLEWQHLRRYSIGGSEAAVVVGKVDENGDQIDGFTQLSKFQTRRSLFYEKQATFVEEPNPPQKQQIFDFGHCVEPYVIQKAAKELGAKQYPEYRMFAHRDYPFITCNPDGILIFPDGSLCLFEAKSATRHKREDWETGIPGYYVPQPRQYMEVLDDPRIAGGYIGCCFGPGKFDYVLHKYERDWILGKKQMEIEAKFWCDYIAAGVVPPLSGNAELDMEAVYGYEIKCSAVGTANGAPMSADCEALLVRYHDLEGQRKPLSAAARKAYEKERLLKRQIAEQCPEGLTVVRKENQVSYRISLKASNCDSVDSSKLSSRVSSVYTFCSRLTNKLEDEHLPFTNPKVVYAKVAGSRTSKKKAAATTP